MALLFDNDDPDASQGFKNLKAAPEDSEAGKIRLGLEKLWNRFKPYADKYFIKEFVAMSRSASGRCTSVIGFWTAARRL
jgi:hypothetical protein